MMKLELTKFQFPDEDGDVVRQDSLSEKDDGEYNEKENMLMMFKTFLYTVVFILFILAASVIFMGIEGNHLKFKNLKNCRLRYDFGERLSEWLKSDKPRAQSLRDQIGLHNTLSEFQYEDIIEKQLQENYTRIQQIVGKKCSLANYELKSWNTKSWGDSFMYSSSVMSTVGWGVYYPPDTRLRIVTLVYLFFGIPIFASLINCISAALDSLEKCLAKKKTIQKCIGNHTNLEILWVIFVILAVLIYAVICDIFVEEGRDDVLEAQLEDAVLNYSWTYFISVYYTIVTVTSIGFGDIYVYSPNHFLLIKTIFCLFLTAFLIAFFAKIFSKVRSKVDKVATKRAQKRMRQLRLGVIPVELN